MNLNLEDKKALVIGSSSGIGAATARILAEEGADIVLAYHQDITGAERILRYVEAAGRRCWLCKFDLRQPKAAAEAAIRVKGEVGDLDIVILCAGQNIVTPYERITPQEWEQVIEVNLSGGFYALQTFSPMVRPGGAIVTVASVAAQTGAPHHMHYAAAKAGLVNLTKSLARALAPNIRVNCVAPGITLTPMGKRRSGASIPITLKLNC
jgi:3-oxoacyl-[acyl-carrier protein] reductase